MTEGEEKFTGISKYFNSFTMKGRANVSKTTLLSVGLISLYFYMRSKSKKA